MLLLDAGAEPDAEDLYGRLEKYLFLDFRLWLLTYRLLWLIFLQTPYLMEMSYF